MKLPETRVGERLRVNRILIPYSFWPTKVSRKGNTRHQTLLFSFDPWVIIGRAIKTSCLTTARREDVACVAQAHDFYESAIDAHGIAAWPLAPYYYFMNLVKAFCLTRVTKSTFDKTQHGLA